MGSDQYKNIGITRRFLLGLIILTSLGTLPLWGQTELHIRSLLDKADQKKLSQADQYKKDAEAGMAEVNRLNLQINSLEEDTAGSEKNRIRIRNLESQSYKKQEQASASYEKYYDIEYTIYLNYLEKFWKDNPGKDTIRLNEKLQEEQAKELHYEASSNRQDAKAMGDGRDKMAKLVTADQLAGLAVNKLITSLSSCYGLQNGNSTGNEQQVKNAVSSPDTLNAWADSLIRNLKSSNSDTLVINQHMIDMYNRYMREGQLTDTSLSTGKLAGLTRFDNDEIHTLWDEYRNRPLGSEDTVQQTIAARTNAFQPEAGESTAVDTTMANVNKPVQEQVISEAPEATDTGLVYRVQIAANRTELSQRALSRIYRGNKKVERISENGWYKYSVGDFSSFKQATQFIKESGLTNAFVVAAGSLAANRQLVNPNGATDNAGMNKPAGFTKTEIKMGLEFRVQVAASRNPITTTQMTRICPGGFPVEMIREEGWYKYQLMGVPTYSDATNLLHQITTAGAFITAYRDGAKLPVAEAVKESRKSEADLGTVPGERNRNRIEFHVQLLASRAPVNPGDWKRESGSEQDLCLVLDDGWYKIQVKAGYSLKEALALKKQIGIKGAFIVAYRKGKKIALSEVMNEIK